MTLKWHILTDDHSYTMLFEGGTPLNNPPIETHANSSMFALIFWPHVTIFCIFWLHKCLKWILEFNSKSLFWCQSRQIFEVRAIEQRRHEFQLIHMPPHQFWPRYHSDGLSPVHIRFEFFSKQICNVEALICHFYKNIKTLTQIHFPRDVHIFRTCTIFYRHYKGLHQMRKDLVLCALDRGQMFSVTLWVVLCVVASQWLEWKWWIVRCELRVSSASAGYEFYIIIVFLN